MKHLYFLVLFIIIVGACTNQKKGKSTAKDIYAADHTSEASVDRPEDRRWVRYYNLNSDSLRYLYDSSAVKILPDGEIIHGNILIADYLLSQSRKIVSLTIDTTIIAHEERGISYEISKCVYDDGRHYKNLIIWEIIGSRRKRVLEFSSELKDTDTELSEIDKRRELWIQLCNKHDARGLIYDLYTSNTLYYNHRPVIQGRASLVAEYQYMNDEQYTLSLQPHVVDRVNGQFVFEIGQCSGSYKGKYLLIWRKDADGIWRIFIDSNI